MMLTNGIKTGEYDAAVLSINADTSGARINFEKAQLRLLGFKSLINESKRNQHNMSSVEVCGRGGGGRGRCRRGPGRGRGHGDGLAPRRADTTNCSKHVTTVGGQDLSVAKLPNGDCDTVQISRGTHDHLAKKQVHTNKTWYLSPVYGEMEPLERSMLFINQSVEKGQGKGGGRPVSSVADVSVAESQMYAMIATLSGMRENIAGLLNDSEKHQRKIEKIIIKQREDKLFSRNSSSSYEYDIMRKQGNQALARGSLKSKKRKKGT